MVARPNFLFSDATFSTVSASTLKTYAMKKTVLLIFALSSGLLLKAQDIIPAKKSMLGFYNTSTFSAMPVVRTNSNYFNYDLIYYPVQQEARAAYSVRNTSGYRFFDALNVGLGTGLENFESSALLIPVYAEISGNMLNKRFTPIYYVQVGYDAAVNISGKNQSYRPKKVEGGLSTLAGIGFGARLDKSTVLRLNFGYRLQQASYTYDYLIYGQTGSTQTRNMMYHRAEVGLSFTFQK